MIAKLSVVFFVVALTALLVALDYQHGTPVSSQPERAMTPSSSAALELALKPVDTNQPQADLSDFRGRFVLINAWATWCPPCVHEFPSLITLAREYPQKLQLVTLSADRTREKAQDFLEAYDVLDNVYHAYDPGGKLARGSLQIYRYPESLLLDADGKLIAKYAGVLNETHLQEIRDYITQ